VGGGLVHEGGGGGPAGGPVLDQRPGHPPVVRGQRDGGESARVLSLWGQEVNVYLEEGSEILKNSEYVGTRELQMGLSVTDFYYFSLKTISGTWYGADRKWLTGVQSEDKMGEGLAYEEWDYLGSQIQILKKIEGKNMFGFAGVKGAQNKCLAEILDTAR